MTLGHVDDDAAPTWWRHPDGLRDHGEYVVRLAWDAAAQHRTGDAFWLGKSVHQIAVVDGDGDVWCCGRKIDRRAIAGWMPLPE